MAVDGGARHLSADEEYVSSVINQVVLDRSIREQLGFADGSSGFDINVQGFASLLECLSSKPTVSLFLYWVKRAYTATLCVRLSDQDAAFRRALGVWLPYAVDDLEEAMLKQMDKHGNTSVDRPPASPAPMPSRPRSPAASWSSNFSSVGTFRLPIPPSQQVARPSPHPVPSVLPQGNPDLSYATAGSTSSVYTAGSTGGSESRRRPSKPPKAQRKTPATSKSNTRTRAPVPSFSAPSVHDPHTFPAPSLSYNPTYDGSSMASVQVASRRRTFTSIPSRGAYESNRRPEQHADSGWVKRGRSSLAISSWTPPTYSAPPPSTLPPRGVMTQRPLRDAPRMEYHPPSSFDEENMQSQRLNHGAMPTEWLSPSPHSDGGASVGSESV